MMPLSSALPVLDFALIAFPFDDDFDDVLPHLLGCFDDLELLDFDAKYNF